MARIKKIFFLLVMLLALAVAAAGYFYWQLHRIKSDPMAVAQDENKALIEAVGKLIMLPNEQPTVATVTDPAKLSDQAFFKNAKVGYKVLVYSQAKKAILYDPATNKIVEVGPVNVTDENSGGVATPPVEEESN